MIRFNNIDSTISGLYRTEFFQNELNTKQFGFEPPAWLSKWVTEEMLESDAKEKWRQELEVCTRQMFESYKHTHPEPSLPSVSPQDLQAILIPSNGE